MTEAKLSQNVSLAHLDVVTIGVTNKDLFDSASFIFSADRHIELELDRRVHLLQSFYTRIYIVCLNG